MRWLRNISFSPSSTVKTPGDSDDHNYRGLVWRFGASKYSRRKKLRNLSGREPATVSLPKWSDSASSEAASLSRSPSTSVHAVPLPLPETSPLFQRREANSNSNSGSGDVDCPLPSPKIPHKIGAGAGTNAPIKSVFDCRERQKKEDHGETRSSTRANQDLRGYPEKSRNSFRIDVPSRSAPTSPFASPALSPPRNGSGNLSNFHYVAPVGNQGWSAPELPNSHYVPSVRNHGWSAPELPISAMMRGVPPAFFDGCVLSSESSPMHSPTVISPHQDARSPTGPASPLQTKISHETHAARRESSGTVSVHPLPLPPGVPMHSPSTSIPLPSTSMPTPSTSIPLRSTSLPSPSTSMPLPSTSIPSSSTAIPSTSTPIHSPSTPIHSPSTPITQANTKTESMSMKDQWQKGKLIGRGTFGSVYVASNRENGALCAMKEVELFPDDPKSAECIKQLEQEIKVLSQLKHPNIVQYYGSDIVEDRLYIYLEYVHPGSINKYVREHCGAMTESVVRNFTRHILSGLAYLHSTKTIHRDIKGANLLVDSCGVVKLADFGMAKHLTGQVADLSLKGSPYWMAPELLLSVMQKDNSSDLALAVDIWSLGCTIIEMFTGKPPWSEYEGAAAMFKVMRDTPSIPESLSFEGRDFLKLCFQRNPAERPTASMLLEHPFVKNLQHPDGPSCSQAVGANLLDKCYSPREQYSSKFDQFPMFPSPQNSKGRIAAESVIGLLSHHETCDLTAKSRYSPRSTLEALPISSPPDSVQNVYHLGSPANMPNIVNHSNKNHTLL